MPVRRNTPASSATPTSSMSPGRTDNLHEVVGKYVQDKGFKNVVLVAPNYPGGKDAMVGFKRYYTGKVGEEIYTKLGQLDYAAELAQIRSLKPDAVFFFLPGGDGDQLRQAVRRCWLVGRFAAFRSRLFGRRGRDPRGWRADARHVQLVALGARHGQRREQAFSSPISRRNSAACLRSTPRRATTRRC